MPDDAQVDPRETIDSLRRELAARTAERDEALAERAVISEIVQIINRSGGDLGPVFDAMLEKALRLCEAAFGMLWTYDGELVQFAAARGHPRFDEWTRGVGPSRVHPGSTVERLLRGEPVVHIPDAREDETYRSGNPRRRLLVDVGGARSYLTVPLRKGDNLVGAFAIYRQEVRPFSDKQIALLQNFAAQAVIAMENARLLGELRERTQELTSREGALRRSEERYALAMRAINEGVYEWDVATGSMYYSPRVCELVGLEPSELRTMTDWTDRIHPDDRQSFRNAVVAHFKGETDRLEAEYRYRHVDGSWHWARHHGIALKNNSGRAYRVVGSTGDITDRKAAEEALRETLEQQTATAEVLQVINSSPDDLAPVFDAMLEKAMRLCGADFGVMNRYDGKHFYHAADHGVPSAYARYRRERGPINYGSGTTPARLVAGENLIQTADLMATEAYERGEPARRALVDLGRARTHLTAALRKGDVLLGDISIYRQEVRPFSDKQTALLQNFAAQAVIAMENARLLGETREALEQQTATAEVSQVINSSPGDLDPVFDAMLEKALRLCDASFGVLSRIDRENFNGIAVHGAPPELAEALRQPRETVPGNAHYRLVHGEDVVQIADITAEDVYRAGNPARRALADIGGARTALWVALRKDGVALGAFVIYRQEVRPFTDNQISLLQNFAAQAVIAMENARLLTETREALEQQTATADVLQVINSSPGDLAPVFDAILEKAHILCGAAHGSLQLYDGESLHAVATHAVSDKFAEVLREGYRAADSPASRALIEGERFVQITDCAEIDHPVFRDAAELSGIRTVLFVPLRRDDSFLGLISAARREVRPFSNKQIALLENFAAQAVIAIENARLLTETREALEQQTATAEVLQVINSSPGDLAPVFDAILEKAIRLCDADCGQFSSIDGQLFTIAAIRGEPRLAEWLRQRGPVRPGLGTTMDRILWGENLIQVVDMKNDEAYRRGDPTRRMLVDVGGYRSGLSIALRKEGRLLGAFTINRKQVRPFTDKQIALLQSFGAQAAIAIENARLITETREALEQQTATAEVLQVINSSPGDLVPVFDAMLERAMHLCEAAFGGLWTLDEDRYVAVAMRNVPAACADFFVKTTTIPGPGTAPYRFLHGERLAHEIDLASTEPYKAGDPARRALVDLGGARTALQVPLRKEHHVLGVITIYRQEVRPFSDKQIALLENFATQAVIAMENARLLTETREALEQQTATAEVLQVINSSPGDLAPVFDAMLERALRVSESALGFIATYDGEHFHMAAGYGLPPAFAEIVSRPYRPPPGSPTWRLIDGESFVQIADLLEDEFTVRGLSPVHRALVEAAGGRSFLTVPLRREGVLVGVIVIYRREVRPFTDKQIALLQNFAAQAVIAIENARLLGELRERTHDLEESLEYQTATSDVLQVISRSTFDLQPVLQTVLDTAVRLCRAGPSEIFRMESDGYRFAVGHGMTPEYEALERAVVIHPDPDTLVGRTALERRVVHVLDAWTDPLYSQKEEARIGNFHTMLGVPLMREGEVAGVIALSRRLVEPFSEREIQLVTTFADQAVIAIENTRLITETREALEQQTATAEILEVINRSPGNLQPVFDAVLENATNLCAAQIAVLWMYDGDQMDAAAILGAPPEYEQFLRQGARPLSPTHERLRAGEEVIQIVNVPEYEGYRSGWSMARALFDLGRVRTILLVPLRSEDDILGAFAVYRQETRAFSDKQVALLQNFAAQAVIAIDNARLLDAIRQRQAELRVTFDNMGDGVAMFDGELRLAAWNLNFQRVLDVPDDLLAERPSYSDYIRFLARRGEFGNADIEAELSRRLEGLGQELRSEHTRPDGRIIEVRRNAVPGGGFVIIYGDVTERKRAEAEIHAARDTAERALRELQTAQASLVHAQKMAALGQLTAGIAHEIKNPLNFVNNFAELSGELLLELKETTAPAVAALGDDERAVVDEVVEMLRGNLDKIAEHGKRADGIVKSMLEHSRGISGERRLVDLNALIEEALNLAYHGARAQDASFNITLEREFDRGLAPTELAPQEMTRVFLNLFGNGFYATAKRQRDGGGAGFRPTLKVATRELGDAVEVRVRDNGCGIVPEIRDKLFQPFVTTKPTGEGTGLGLSISYDIVIQQHGGTIEVDSRPGEFTEFTIRLPRPR